MSRGLRGFRSLFVAGAAAAAVVTGLLSPPANAAGDTGGTTGAAAGATRVTAGGSAGSPVTAPATARLAGSYWTKARMLSAIPATVPELDAKAAAKLRPAGPQGGAGRVSPAPAKLRSTGIGPLADPGATAATWGGSAWSAPATTSGKVFFVGADGLNYVCSGSTVNSNGKRVVFTAGHCVARFGRWFNAQPWIFVPGYNNGNAPFGQWSAAQLWTRTAWLNNDNRAEDMGAAVMNTDAWGRRIVDVVGGQGIEWNFPLVQYQFQFGYPQRTPFDGQLLEYCTGTSFNDGGDNGISCNMTEGASGGPWIDDFNGTFGWIDSVNSWVFWNSSGVRFKWNGPYFGNNAADLYNTVANL